MFVYNINPVLAKLGPFEIRYYGIIFALGFVIAYVMMRYYAKKGTLHMDVESLDEYILYLIIGVVVGARLFEVLFWEPAYYFANPIKMLAIWEGGLSYHGGLVGAVIVTYLFCKRHRLRFMNIADHLVIPASFALALGRVANFINGEVWGTVADPARVPWCVVFPHVDSSCRHPVQIYNAIMWLVIGIVLVVLWKRIYSAENSTEKKTYGIVFWWFVLINGFGRLLLDFWREDPRFLGMSTGQYFSLLLVIVGSFVLLRHYRSAKVVKNAT